MTGDGPLDADEFKPPIEPVEIACVRCGATYDSRRIIYRVDHDADGNLRGFWNCPVAGCEGHGFGHDLVPIEHDLHSDDEDEDEVDDEDEDDFDRWLDDDSDDLDPDDTPLDLPGQPHEGEDIPF